MLKTVEPPQDAAEEGKWSLAEPGARRSLILLALGAAVGLGIAAAVLMLWMLMRG